ncbi:unnamed protein product [Diatraea saccharalis]|uniref:Uncharacterized protein n=1 Tax=Diatraea saccharalis TaxID=40085 RepID=A0A9N9QWJ2_9NEOP|nr:unnamed protein product [Diatraea saccharalis]
MAKAPNKDALQELRVDSLTHKPRRGRLGNNTGNIVTGRSDFVYVNPVFVASTHNVRIQEQQRSIQAPTSVVIEQYWACSRWTSGQRFLAIAVAVLLGAVVGLAVTVVLTKGNPNDLVGGGIFSRFNSAPD